MLELILIRLLVIVALVAGWWFRGWLIERENHNTKTNNTGSIDNPEDYEY
jgi:hypothetical protein